MNAMPDTVRLRPATAVDRAFLARVYASTREEEMRLTGWTRAAIDAFLQQQFEAQDRFYREHFGEARFDIVCCGDADAGRLYVDRQPDEVRIVDIALLPEYRNRGIGGALLRDLIAESEDSGRVLRIHVEHGNPALSLYERLGFQRVADRGVHLLLERPAIGNPEAAAE